MIRRIAALGAAVVLAAAALGAWAGAEDAKGVEAKAAFAKLKALAGEWTVTSEHGAGKIVYKVTANGTTVMETDFPGSAHEMITMYHLDGSNLKATHYCSAGNQPRLKLDLAGSTPDRLKFDFDGGSNLDASKDMHIHGCEIAIKDANHAEATWQGFLGGKKAMDTKFVMSRP